MGNYVTRDDFEWSSQEEPHAKRRVEILSMFMDTILEFFRKKFLKKINSKIFLFHFQKNILKLRNCLV